MRALVDFAAENGREHPVDRAAVARMTEAWGTLRSCAAVAEADPAKETATEALQAHLVDLRAAREAAVATARELSEVEAVTPAQVAQEISAGRRAARLEREICQREEMLPAAATFDDAARRFRDCFTAKSNAA